MDVNSALENQERVRIGGQHSVASGSLFRIERIVR